MRRRCTWTDQDIGEGNRYRLTVVYIYRYPSLFASFRKSLVVEMAYTEKPILFHYEGSIFSHKVLWYLWLRGIEYDECVRTTCFNSFHRLTTSQIQPAIMPRPDLELIDVGYRKVPIMAIGKDIYSDSRLIISKLETLFSDSPLTLSTPAEEGTRKLFENWTSEGGVFWNAVKLVPYWVDGGLLSNKAFVDDREKLTGKRMTKEVIQAGRSDGAQHMQQAFDMMESTFLADGRDWVLGTKEPSLADIDAAWPFKWLLMEPTMVGSLPSEHFTKERYPKLYTWVERFVAETEKKGKRLGQVTALDGKAMAERTFSASSSSDDVSFIDGDPLGLQKEDDVEVFPADYGQVGKSTGKLIGLTTHEVVICNSKGLNLHFPRWNFSIKKVGSRSKGE
jgi:glutathione S-transferase